MLAASATSNAKITKMQFDNMIGSLFLVYIWIFSFIHVADGLTGVCPLQPGTCAAGWSDWTPCPGVLTPSSQGIADTKASLTKLGCIVPYDYWTTTLESVMIKARANLATYRKSKNLTLTVNVRQPQPLDQPMQALVPGAPPASPTVKLQRLLSGLFDTCKQGLADTGLSWPPLFSALLTEVQSKLPPGLNLNMMSPAAPMQPQSPFPVGAFAVFNSIVTVSPQYPSFPSLKMRLAGLNATQRAAANAAIGKWKDAALAVISAVLQLEANELTNMTAMNMNMTQLNSLVMASAAAWRDAGFEGIPESIMFFSPNQFDSMLPEPCVALKNLLINAKSDPQPTLLTTGQNVVKSIQGIRSTGAVFDFDEVPVNITDSPLAGCGFCHRRIRCCKDKVYTQVDQKLQSEICQGHQSACEVPPLSDGTCSYDKQLPAVIAPISMVTAPPPPGMAFPDYNAKFMKVLRERERDRLLALVGAEKPLIQCISYNNLCYCCCGPYVPMPDPDGYVWCRPGHLPAPPPSPPPTPAGPPPPPPPMPPVPPVPPPPPPVPTPSSGAGGSTAGRIGNDVVPVNNSVPARPNATTAVGGATTTMKPPSPPATTNQTINASVPAPAPAQNATSNTTAAAAATTTMKPPSPPATTNQTSNASVPVPANSSNTTAAARATTLAPPLTTTKPPSPPATGNQTGPAPAPAPAPAANSSASNMTTLAPPSGNATTTKPPLPPATGNQTANNSAPAPAPAAGNATTGNATTGNATTGTTTMKPPAPPASGNGSVPASSPSPAPAANASTGPAPPSGNATTPAAAGNATGNATTMKPPAVPAGPAVASLAANSTVRNGTSPSGNSSAPAPPAAGNATTISPSNSTATTARPNMTMPMANSSSPAPPALPPAAANNSATPPASTNSTTPRPNATAPAGNNSAPAPAPVPPPAASNASTVAQANATTARPNVTASGNSSAPAPPSPPAPSAGNGTVPAASPAPISNNTAAATTAGTTGTMTTGTTSRPTSATVVATTAKSNTTVAAG